MPSYSVVRALLVLYNYLNKESAGNTGDLGLEKGMANPWSSLALKTTRDRGAWQAIWDLKESDMTE